MSDNSVLDAQWEPSGENPNKCSDPIRYHNRVMLRRNRRAERLNRFVCGLFRFSLVSLIWAVSMAVLVGMVATR